MPTWTPLLQRLSISLWIPLRKKFQPYHIPPHFHYWNNSIVHPSTSRRRFQKQQSTTALLSSSTMCNGPGCEKVVSSRVLLCHGSFCSLKGPSFILNVLGWRNSQIMTGFAMKYAGRMLMVHHTRSENYEIVNIILAVVFFLDINLTQLAKHNCWLHGRTD